MNVDPDRGSDEAGALSPAIRRVVAAGLVVYVALLGFNSLTRLRGFTPDSMFYTGMAENLVKGHGLSHCIHGVKVLRTLGDAREPRPISTWPPLFPLFAGALHAAGVPAPDAALVVAVLFGGVILLGVYLLSRELFGESIAVVAVTALLVYEPLHRVSSVAWSETTGIAFVILALYVLVLPQIEGGRWVRYGLPLAGGVLGGLAFATRYAFAPIVLVGGVALVDGKNLKKTLANLGLFAVGFLLIASPVLVRNFIITGAPLGYPRAPSTQGLLLNLFDLYMVLAWRWFPRLFLPGLVQAALFWVFAIVLLAQFARRKGRSAIAGALGRTVFRGKRYVPALWCAGYLLFLLIYRTMVHLDRIGPRLAAPATLVLVVILVAFVVYLSAPRTRTLAMVALALLALGLTREIVVARGERASHNEMERALPERLQWIGRNTTARDLVIGHGLAPVPFYFGQRPLIVRYDLPLAQAHVYYESLMAYAQRYCEDYDRIFFVTQAKTHHTNEEQWRTNAGDFVTDLVFGRVDNYPNVALFEELEDGAVFQIQCGTRF